MIRPNVKYGELSSGTEQVAEAGIPPNGETPLQKHLAFIDNTRFYYNIRYLTQLGDWLFDKMENVLLSDVISRPIDRPIFPLGNFRSGTSLLEKVIADHPAVGTLTYASQVFPRSPYLTYKVLKMFPAMDKPLLPIHLPNPVRSTSPYEGEPLWRFCRNNYWSAEPVNVLGTDYNDPEFEKHFKRIVNKALAANNTSRFVNKNPWNTLRVGYLSKVFPDAKFLYIVRNPFDMVHSQLELERLSAAAWQGMPYFNEVFSDQFAPPRLFFRTPAHAKIMKAYMTDKAVGVAQSIVDFDSVFEQEVEKAGIADRLLRLRFEDLVTEFESHMQRVFDFAELDTAGAAAAIKSNAQGYVDRGRTRKSKPEPLWRNQVVELLKPLLVKYGYER